MVKIKRALISVYDKTGLGEFVKALKELDVEIVSTGGTAEFIKSQGIEVKYISDVTNFPEILDGRVKTLHPKVHGALLSLRESHAHLAEARAHDIEMIDMVVVNLYPFAEVIKKPDADLGEILENIDIGGPTMLRSAAKNYRSVAAICNPSRYAGIIDEMKSRRGLITDETLSSLAVEVFKVTSEYDRVVNAYLGNKILTNTETAKENIVAQQEQQSDASIAQEPNAVQEEVQVEPKPTAQDTPAQQESLKPKEDAPAPEESTPTETEKPSSFPEVFNVPFKKIEDLRYGENSHQKACFYKNENFTESSIANAKQLHGKQMSLNNILDMNAALEFVKEFDKPAAGIIKHTNPCGAAIADSLVKAYADALECDKMSAYGSIIGLNRAVDASTADAILSSGFVECIVAPGYESSALEKLKTKQNIRILEVAPFPETRDASEYSIKQIAGGLLVQEKDLKNLDQAQLRIVTKKKPSAEEVESLLFAWKVVKHVKSNAIVLAKDTRTVGIGAGQMSRVDSVYISTYKAAKASKGSVLASDAFFPKTDAVEMAARSGVTAIIQPGGSKADEEIIKTADRRGLTMVFTGIRHFKH